MYKKTNEERGNDHEKIYSGSIRKESNVCHTDPCKHLCGTRCPHIRTSWNETGFHSDHSDILRDRGVGGVSLRLTQFVQIAIIALRVQRREENGICTFTRPYRIQSFGRFQ